MAPHFEYIEYLCISAVILDVCSRILYEDFMTNPLTIALAQCNLTVGDIAANSSKIIALTQSAAAQGAELVVFPEMAITGYPAEDLLFKEVFQQAAMQAAQDIAHRLKDCPAAALVGGYWVEDGGIRRNCALLIYEGRIQHHQYKHCLPNYGVFDEKRLFTKGDAPQPFSWRGHQLGILICEDLWQPSLAKSLAQGGAQLILSLNASPFEVGKQALRRDMAQRAARESGVPIVYCNLVGGQDELVFDGNSFVMNEAGEITHQLAGFKEELAIVRLDALMPPIAPPPADDLADIYSAMTLGLHDYVHKNGFKGVVIGLSGGIDSGLTAAVAVDALGAGKVHALMMPSPYTSAESIEDAQAIAKQLGITLHHIAIDAGMRAFDEMLSGVFAGTQPDSTEENIQARLRGNILMAYSNKHGYMVLTTGNKSEMSVGYATLYGDMCGGYSVLKDVYKTTVFALSHWRNTLAQTRQQTPPIPERMISKPPSAELKPNQRDDDTLPPYPVLDAILQGLIEQRLSIAQVIENGFDAATVERVAKLIYMAEYKRRQSPPGVKITGMAFGRDRRYPITNRWIQQR